MEPSIHSRVMYNIWDKIHILIIMCLIVKILETLVQQHFNFLFQWFEWLHRVSLRWPLLQLHCTGRTLESHWLSEWLCLNVWPGCELVWLVSSLHSWPECPDAKHMYWWVQMWHSCPTVVKWWTPKSRGWSGHPRCLWSLEQ